MKQWVFKMTKQHTPQIAVVSIVLFSSLLFAACAHLPGAKNPQQNATDASSTVIGSAKPSAATTLVLTGDLQGKMIPHALKTRDPEHTAYERGGIGNFSAQLKILRSNVQGDLLWLDAGDSLSGSWDGLQDHGARQIEWLNQAGLQATTVGSEDLELPIELLQKRILDSKFPWIVTNARSTLPKEIEPLTKTSAVFGSVGVIGIRLQGTAASIAAEVQPEIDRLNQKNVKFVVALIGHPAKTEPGLFSQLLKMMGKKNIDIAVGAPERKVSSSIISGVPVVQVGTQNQFFGIAVVSATAPKTAKIENPIPICGMVFKNQGNCLGDERAPKKGRGALIPATFLGKELEPTAQATKTLADLDADAKNAQTKPKVILGESLTHPDACVTESLMGQYVAEIVRKKANADVVLLSCGFIRSGLMQGPVTDEMLFKSMPLDSEWVTLSLTGAELKTLVEITHSGAARVFPDCRHSTTHHPTRSRRKSF